VSQGLANYQGQQSGPTYPTTMSGGNPVISSSARVFLWLRENYMVSVIIIQNILHVVITILCVS